MPEHLVERTVNFVVDLIESRSNIPYERYEDEIWGSDKSFRRFRKLVNEIWKRRRGIAFFELVDANGRPAIRGPRFFKLMDQALLSSKIERMAVIPAFMQFLHVLKGTILSVSHPRIHASYV